MSEAVTGTQGVVLSSGGADGAYAVGVLKALINGKSPATNYTPLDPGVFVGTSIGSLNSALLVSDAEAGMSSAVARLEKIWLEEMAENSQGCGNGAYRLRVNPLNFLDPQCLASNPFQSIASFAEDSIFLSRDFLERGRNFVVSDGTLEQRAIHLINFSSFVSSAPLSRLIERSISFENIRRSPTALRVIATNWDRGAVETFHNEHFTDTLGPKIIGASSAVPGFFPHVEFNGNTYVDGAVLGYTRLAPAIDAGAETLHVIYVDPNVENIPNEALESTLETLYRVFVIGWAARVNEGIDAVKKINEQLDVLEEMMRRSDLSKDDVQPLLLTLVPSNRAKEKVIKITLHRYHPKDDLFGPLGLLNLDRDRIEGLIERGFEDAVLHDCVQSRCVVPASKNLPENLKRSS